MALSALSEASYRDICVMRVCGPLAVRAALKAVSPLLAVCWETTRPARSSRAFAARSSARLARARASAAAEVASCQCHTAPLYASDACSAATAEPSNAALAVERSAWISLTDRSASTTCCCATATSCWVGMTGSSEPAEAVGLSVTVSRTAAPTAIDLDIARVDNTASSRFIAEVLKSPYGGDRELSTLRDVSDLRPQLEHLSQY